MSATNYRQFVDETLALARSLVIKNKACIIGINEELQALGYTVEDDPKTWRYYKNIAGEYHETDEAMSVTSLDTQKTIEFSAQELDRHVLTRENYKPGTSYHKALVARFPDQELLIRGIVSPANKDDAIAAEDFSVIYYDDSFVEDNETNLVIELERRIKDFSIRWHTPSYAVVDELYTMAHFAILFHQLPTWLFNIRLNNCKTRYAHSYHIREYLRSNGALGKYFDYLTKEQMLFLYRNILYIENNAGKRDTFEWLTERLLTDRGIGLAEYQLHHNLVDLPEELRGKPEFTRRGLNIYHRSTRSEQHSLEDLLIKERPLAQRNAEVEQQALIDDSKSIVQSKRGNFPTKALESAIVDRSESGVITRSKYLFYYWIHWSSTGYYQASIEVTHPRTGTIVRLPADHAFLLYLYAYNKSNGFTLETVPNVMAQGVRRTPAPDFDALRSITQKEFIPDSEVAYFANLNDVDQLNQPLSAGQFAEQVTTLFSTFAQHRRYYGLKEHMIARAQAEQLIYHLYMDAVTDFDDAGKTYDEWFIENSYPFTDLSEGEFGILATALLQDATGANQISDFDVRDVQNAMIELMTQLSSYSVQYIQEINSGSIIDWEWSATRLGRHYESNKSLQRITMVPRFVVNTLSYGVSHIDLQLNNVVRANLQTNQNSTVPVETGTDWGFGSAQTIGFRMKIPSVRFKVLEQ